MVRTDVSVTSFAEAAQVVACAVAVARADADDHLWMDMRTDRVILSVRNRQLGYVTPFDVELVERLSATFHDRGWCCRP